MTKRTGKRNIPPFPAPASFKELTGKRNGGIMGVIIMRHIHTVVSEYRRLGGELKNPVTSKYCSILTMKQVMAEQLLKSRLEQRQKLQQKLRLTHL